MDAYIDVMEEGKKRKLDYFKYSLNILDAVIWDHSYSVQLERDDFQKTSKRKYPGRNSGFAKAISKYILAQDLLFPVDLSGMVLT